MSCVRSRAAQALYFSVLTYRYEENRGADEAVAGTEDPNTLEARFFDWLQAANCADVPMRQ